MTTSEGYAELARLREVCPVAQPRPGVKVLVGYDEAVQVLRDTDRFSGRHDRTLPVEERMLVEADPIDHMPRRRILGALFSPERLDAIGPAVASASARLVAGVVARRSAELVGDLATPLIAEVVATLVGIPEADRAQVYAWVADMARDDGLPHAVRDRRSPATWHSFRAWALAQVEGRRSGDVVHDDGLAQLLEPDPLSGEVLGDDELILDLRSLCQAGLGATGRLIGNLLYELIVDQDLFRRIQADAGLAAKAVEESLRHTPPIQFLMRTCIGPSTVAGVPMVEDDRIVMSLSSINRDERRCPRAGEFDLDRGPQMRHLAFGLGAHYCPGARLARIVAAQALSDLATAVDSIQFSPDFVYEAQQNLLAWGPRRLDVVVTPSAERRAPSDAGPVPGDCLGPPRRIIGSHSQGRS